MVAAGAAAAAAAAAVVAAAAAGSPRSARCGIGGMRRARRRICQRLMAVGGGMENKFFICGTGYLPIRRVFLLLLNIC